MSISLSGNLGEDYARGWRNLPPELKLNVFGRITNLRISTSVDIRRRGGTIGHHKPIPYNGIDELLPYLAMGPEIAPFALRIFYEQNTYRLTASLGIWNDDSLTARLNLLRTHHRPYIRRITVNLPVNLRSISNIQSLASGVQGFPQLQHVEIVFIWEPAFTNAPDSTASHQFHAVVKRETRSDPFQSQRCRTRSVLQGEVIG